VFRLDEEKALVQTVDFFTPVVDDPLTFGRIAAANALSDVYAMGGRPLTALSIAAFPDQDFPMEWAAAIVRGGAEVLRAAECALVGGHSVRDPELKFGYAVTGLVDPRHMLTNAGGAPGQVLVLTKPLGTGVISTALKAGVAGDDAVRAATLSMTALNRAASEAALRWGVTGATDVTGFGLAGHALALARGSGITLDIDAPALPLLPRALDLAPRHQAGGLKANRLAFEADVEYEGSLHEGLRLLVYDPQTSGGLLLLADERVVADLLHALPGSRAIGRAELRGERPLRVRS
jgi:selenide,water dikinase